MKWRDTTWSWKRRFALLPFSLNGQWHWLVWYWQRFCGDCYEVSLGKDMPRNEGEGSYMSEKPR